MNINEAYSLIDDAISELTRIDNDWEFQRIGTLYQYQCMHSGHEEARIWRIDIDPHGNIIFHVEDKGVVRFVDGSTNFNWFCDASVSDAQERTLILNGLISTLNEKHNITPPVRVVWTYETLQPLSRTRLNEIYTELTGRDAPNESYPDSYVITQIINAQ